MENFENEFIKAIGKLDIIVASADGSIKDERHIDNLIVTVGKGFIASRMKDTTQAAMSHMAIGTGTAAASAGDTTLGTESARVALTSTTVTGNQIVYVATFGAGVPAALAAITEAGIFNAGTAGTMLNRAVFAAVNKDTTDIITITWTVTVN